MSFTADWLATRRAADGRARNADIAARLQRHFSDQDSLKVLDLGCGTGANLATTSALLPRGQMWTLVDNDPNLLCRIQPVEDVLHRTVEADLSQDLELLFNNRPNLVTASALFDLAGTAFIDRMVQNVIDASAVFFTVLTYDGEEEWHPAHPADSAVLSAFHADQHADKGLGPALGPNATEYLSEKLKEAGYFVHTGKSDWALTQTEDAPLIHMLADGIHEATAPALGDVAAKWREARKSAGAVRIGHHDLVAFPAKRLLRQRSVIHHLQSRT